MHAALRQFGYHVSHWQALRLLDIQRSADEIRGRTGERIAAPNPTSGGARWRCSRRESAYDGAIVPPRTAGLFRIILNRRVVVSKRQPEKRYRRRLAGMTLAKSRIC